MNNFEQPKLPDSKQEAEDAAFSIYNMAGIMDSMTEEIRQRCLGEGKYTSLKADLNDTIKKAQSWLREVPDEAFKTDRELPHFIVRLKELLRSIKYTKEHYDPWYHNVSNEVEKEATIKAFDTYLNELDLVKKYLESLMQKY